MKLSLSQSSENQIPNLRISQRMKLDQTQLEGVEKRIQNKTDHCLLLGLPCGVDADDIQKQSRTLQTRIITYLLEKQAAGIINLRTSQVKQMLSSIEFMFSRLGYTSPSYISTLSFLVGSSFSSCSRFAKHYIRELPFDDGTGQHSVVILLFF